MCDGNRGTETESESRGTETESESFCCSGVPQNLIGNDNDIDSRLNNYSSEINSKQTSTLSFFVTRCESLESTYLSQ